MASRRIAPALTRDRLEHFHRHAHALRERAGAHDDAPVDPFALAAALGVHVAYTDEFDVADFSGNLQVRGGRPVALLNSRQTPERLRVTLLEEICHLHYVHPPEAIGPDGREHNAAVEQEAYQTAAAVLLPAVAVAKAVFRGTPLTDLARDYGASLQLVEMRVKVLGLWAELRNSEKREAA